MAAELTLLVTRLRPNIDHAANAMLACESLSCIASEAASDREVGSHPRKVHHGCSECTRHAAPRESLGLDTGCLDIGLFEIPGHIDEHDVGSTKSQQSC